jgi:hypothetical protein
MMSAVGGHVPIAFISLPAAVTFIKEGKLRGLAITSNARSKLLPEVPTMAEAGFGDQESIFMQGVLFPAGTPQDIVDRWYREIADCPGIGTGWASNLSSTRRQLCHTDQIGSSALVKVIRDAPSSRWTIQFNNRPGNQPKGIAGGKQ